MRDTTCADAGDTEHAVDGASAPVNKLCGGRGMEEVGICLGCRLSPRFLEFESPWGPCMSIDTSCVSTQTVCSVGSGGLSCQYGQGLTPGRRLTPLTKTGKLLSVNDYLRKNIHQSFYHFLTLPCWIHSAKVCGRLPFPMNTRRKETTSLSHGSWVWYAD